MKTQKQIGAIIFLLATTTSFGQTQLLKNYDFEKGGYYLIGVRSESNYNGLADSLREFYTDDIKVLNAIKKEWTFKKPSPLYACGYHYEVMVCKNGLALETFDINLNCNEIETDQGAFYFDTRKLRMFKESFKRPVAETKKFSTLIEARNYRETILKDTSLIMTATPYWVKFEGTFKFTYACPKEDCFKNEKRLLVEFDKQIKMKYPSEPFELHGLGGSKTELEVEVQCNKSLADNFGLYKRDLNRGNWKPYDLWF